MAKCTLEKVGRRYYVRGDSYSLKDTLKENGCKWDATERAWYTANKEAAEAILAIFENAGDKKGERVEVTEGMATEVCGRLQYKGAAYYYSWEGQTKSGDRKAKAVTMDGTKSFWVTYPDYQVTAAYKNKRTIQNLKDYAEKKKAQAKNYDPENPNTWSREQKKEYLDMLDQMDEFEECEQLAREWGIRDY